MFYNRHQHAHDFKKSVKNLLKLDNKQIPKSQHIFLVVSESKIREETSTLNLIHQFDNDAMAIVGSGSLSFGSAWV